MTRRFVISVTAANRVGILAAVTTAADELGGDLLEVSQSVVQEFFTILLAAEFPDERTVEVIHDHIQDACRAYGAVVGVKDPETEDLGDSQHVSGGSACVLTVRGEDRPGIIRQVAVQLAQRGIDITDLRACSDRRAFEIVMQLAVPSDIDLDQLRSTLQISGCSVELS